MRYTQLDHAAHRGIELNKIHDANVRELNDDQFREMCERVVMLHQADRRENQILYYQPVSERAAVFHRTASKYVGVAGGNGSAKTETCLAHMAMLSTGMWPDDMDFLKDQFRGPLNVRVVCESLTTVLHPVILPKLQWWRWTGVGGEGGPQGHYGWIPKLCLVDGSWEKSWSEKLRLLKVLCRDPDDIDKVIGMSTFQMMSHDQDPSDFASGDYHYVLHDEPPRHAIWTENEARTMRVAGRMFLAMTWPDDPGIPVDWIYDDLYDKGRPGPNKSPDHEWIELHTVDNPHLDQDAIALQMRNWTHEMRQVRIYGQPIRFSNRIHPLYCDFTQVWCFSCGRTTEIKISGDRAPECIHCASPDIQTFQHLDEIGIADHWPVVFLLDPHPRKPHMFCWAQIDPSDDVTVILEGEVNGDPGEVARVTGEMEEAHRLMVTLRLMDPNMGRSPSSAGNRELTWQDEFADAGISCELANDSDVGRARLNEFLRPDPFTRRPRLHVRSACINVNHQMKRYSWDEHKRSLEKDLKQRPKPKNDDYPTLLKYLMNHSPQFNWLREGAPIIRHGRRRGAYG